MNQSLETPEMVKKTLLPARVVRQATFSSSQICKEEQVTMNEEKLN